MLVSRPNMPPEISVKDIHPRSTACDSASYWQTVHLPTIPTTLRACLSAVTTRQLETTGLLFSLRLVPQLGSPQGRRRPHDDMSPVRSRLMSAPSLYCEYLGLDNCWVDTRLLSLTPGAFSALIIDLSCTSVINSRHCPLSTPIPVFLSSPFLSFSLPPPSVFAISSQLLSTRDEGQSVPYTQPALPSETPSPLPIVP